jgi:hypothetical protein
MEHRYHSRIPISLDIKLSRRGQNIGRFRTYNIGPDGIAVHLDRPSDLSVNDVVDLYLTVEQDGVWHFPMKGLVVHRSGDELGIMLLDHYPGYAGFVSGLRGQAAA